MKFVIRKTIKRIKSPYPSQPLSKFSVIGQLVSLTEDPFYVGYDNNGNRTRILYGFFFADKNYKDETFTLKWKDGTQDIVKFSSSWKYDEYFNKEAFFNGSEITEWGESGVTPTIRKTIK